MAAAPKLKFCMETLAIGFDGGIVRIAAGEIWAADDPFVKSHPEFFASAPTKVRRTVAEPIPTRAPIETADARPED